MSRRQTYKYTHIGRENIRKEEIIKERQSVRNRKIETENFFDEQKE